MSGFVQPRIGIRREDHPYGYVWRARWTTGVGAGQAVGTAGPGGHGQLLVNMCNHQAAVHAALQSTRRQNRSKR